MSPLSFLNTFPTGVWTVMGGFLARNRLSHVIELSYRFLSLASSSWTDPFSHTVPWPNAQHIAPWVEGWQITERFAFVPIGAVWILPLKHGQLSLDVFAWAQRIAAVCIACKHKEYKLQILWKVMLECSTSANQDGPAFPFSVLQFACPRIND